MTQSDRALLGVLGAAAMLVLWASWEPGGEFGLPNPLASRKKDAGGRTGTKPAPRGIRPSSNKNTPGVGAAGSGRGVPFIDVVGPRIVPP